MRVSLIIRGYFYTFINYNKMIIEKVCMFDRNINLRHYSACKKRNATKKQKKAKVVAKKTQLTTQQLQNILQL